MSPLPPPGHPPSGSIRVGFSGGLDSTVLLHWLKHALPADCRLGAIHVHHGLQEEADAWAAHCHAVCGQWAIDLRIEHVGIAERHRNLEQQARAARYAAFARVLAEGETLALGHHADDVAETLLLRLMRGAGSGALGNMSAHEERAGYRLWRPLLEHPRAQLEAYAGQHGLHWIEDASNADTGFDRNFVRHAVLPLLETRFPNVRARLRHSASRLRADAVLLEPVIAAAVARCRGPAGLQAAALSAQPSAMQAHVLRAWLAEHGQHPPGADALHEFLRQLAGHASDRGTGLDGHGYRLRLWNGNVYLLAATDAAAAQTDSDIAWDGAAPLPLPRGGCLQWQGPAPFPVYVRYRRGGERIRLPGQAMHHSVKKLLSTRLPPWQRAALPFVYNDGHELLAVGDVLVSEQLSRLRGSRLHWHPEPEPKP